MSAREGRWRRRSEKDNGDIVNEASWIGAKRRRGLGTMSPSRFGRQPNAPHARSARYKQESERDRSLPRPVGEAGRRSVGNRKEQPLAATMRVPRGPKATITILIYFDRISAFCQQAARSAGPKGGFGGHFPPAPPLGILRQPL